MAVGPLIENDPNLTLENCAKACSVLGHNTAGVEDGDGGCLSRDAVPLSADLTRLQKHFSNKLLVSFFPQNAGATIRVVPRQTVPVPTLQTVRLRALGARA